MVGVLSSRTLILGVVFSQKSILGVLFSQKSTLGVLLPQEPMNMSGQLGKNLLQGEKADQEDAGHPGLAHLSSILLHPRCLISGDSLTRNEVLTRSLSTADARELLR